MANESADRWVVTLSVTLRDPLTDVQQRSLERLLLALEVHSSRLARLHVAVDGESFGAATDQAIQLAREALVSVDASFARVDVFGVYIRDMWPWEAPGGRSGSAD